MSKIQISALPNVKITGPGIDVVDLSSVRPADILSNIKKDKTYKAFAERELDLIVDKSSSIPRITINDPVNQYFNGRPGDIYRIVDDSATRFRMVAGTSVVDKKKTSPYREVTENMYLSAYNTILDMLKDRRNEGDDDDSEVDKLRLSSIASFDDLKIEGILRRSDKYADQYMYVYYLQNADDSQSGKKRSNGAKGPFKAKVKEFMEAAIAHYNENLNSKKVKLVNPETAEDLRIFMENIELIIVFNNQNNETFKLDMPAQIFSIQQLAFNVVKHIDQPTFYLLDPVKDRKEILDVLSLNGLVLEKSKTLADYNIKEGTKFLLI
jgi:DNA-directed RNA polymerase subunit H (RpoH/RPB5)